MIFTQSEINAINAKNEINMREDCLQLIREKFGKDRVFTDEEVSEIFVWLSYQTVFVPKDLKLSFRRE